MSNGGWLNKKGQDRWFYVKGSTLYWFSSEQDVNSNLALNARGSLNLDSCSLTIHPTKKFCLRISAPGGDDYVLKGKNDVDIQEWYKHLSECIAKSQKKKRKNG